MFAKFFISGEGNFEEEIGRNFREGEEAGLRCQLSGNSGVGNGDIGWPQEGI
jgi:hypothetical protein